MEKPKQQDVIDIFGGSLSDDIIVCPSCGDGTRLQSLAMGTETFVRCQCGDVWEIPTPNVSRMIN